MVEPVDIEELMKEVAEAMDGNGRKTGQASPLTYITPTDHEAEIRDLNLLWTVNPEVSVASDRRFIGSVVAFIKRLIRKSLRWHIRPITMQIQTFHAHVVNAINKMYTRLGTVENTLAQSVQQGAYLLRRLDELENRLNAIDNQALDQRLKLDQRLNKIERSVKNISRAMKDLVKDEVLLQNQDVTLREVQNFDYIGFENHYRGHEDDIRERQADFLRFFQGRGGVLDIGCGRGEFLELLRDNEVKAKGIDFDEDMVDRCKAKGLNVIKAEAISYLRGLKDASLGGIFIGQVVEHLTPNQLVELLELCYQKLKADSYLVVETVNPLCLSVFSSTFYLDISHQKPVHPQFLQFHLQSLGFRDFELMFISPMDDGKKLKLLDEGSGGLSHDKFVLNENLDKLNQLLFSYQDYALAAKK